MSATTYDTAADRPAIRAPAARTATLGLYYSLAIILLWFGMMKFTAYEASNISGFILNSPFIGWIHGFGIKNASIAIGLVEIAAGLLLAARIFAPKLATIGAGIAILTLLMTLSFMLTTPGVFEPAAGGFPALSVLPGQFLLKDLGLLAVAVFCLIESRSTGRA
jgi:uncharacterized membrane protein YkgB